MSSNFKWLEIEEHTFGTNVAATPQNIIFKDTEALENVQKNKKKGNLQDVKLAQTKCQSISMSKIDPQVVGQPYFFISKMDCLQ
jgi:hypothetical protein